MIYLKIGLSYLLETFEVSPDSYETCVSLLNKGELLAFSPGGVREAFFSDHNYEIIWGKQTGFAHVATTAKVVCFYLINLSFNLFNFNDGNFCLSPSFRCLLKIVERPYEQCHFLEDSLDIFMKKLTCLLLRSMAYFQSN